MSVFVGCFAPIFLFWPVLTEVYADVGFEKTDLYPKLMTILVVIAALIGFPVPPYMGNGLALIGFWNGIVANATANGAQLVGATINTGAYFVGNFILGAILLTATILLYKFVFKPNVEPLEKVTVEMLNKNPLPPMDFAQKTYAIIYVVMILCMLLPTFFTSVPVFQFIQNNSYGLGLVVTFVLLVIHDDQGQPLLKFNPVMATKINWGTYFIIAAALIIGTALTSNPGEGAAFQATGITAFLNTILSPIFTGMSGTVFTIAVIIAAVVLTNICNSLVIGMILQPVVLSYCAQSGVAAAPIITILIFIVLLSAAVTPAASPFAAMLFGNKEYLTNGDIYKYCGIIVIVETVITIVVGIPLINLFM
ncbi:MAG: citrate transporter [Erysipelotrichaceae bacterium]|nr:citrate transporter [Erysipelotrichaceae bacterium]